MQTIRHFDKETERGASPAEIWSRWRGRIGIFCLVASAYFIGARLGLGLLTEHEGVAVFWPASGIAAGVLIVLGKHAWPPSALGIVVATTIANRLGDRPLSASLLSGVCNAGEAVLAAFIISQWFGRSFDLDHLSRVLGFLVAATIAAAISAVGGAIAFRLFYTSAPLSDIWEAWFLSDALGIVMTAPVVVGLGVLWRQPLPWKELIEGTTALAVISVMTMCVFMAAPGTWIALVAVVTIFPLLLWMTARCRPFFAATAAFVTVVALIFSMGYGGRFGDVAVSTEQRVQAARAVCLVLALCSLVLAALFAERRTAEANLKRSSDRLNEQNQRLLLALGGAKLGAFSVDLDTGNLEYDTRAAHLHGLLRDPVDFEDARRFVHAEDIPRIDAAFREAKQSGSIWKAEYRVIPPDGHPHAAQTCWVALEGSVIRHRDGRPRRLLAVVRDITTQKQAEEGMRRQAEWERGVLTRISSGVPLSKVLDELVRAAEERSEAGMVASILLLDKEGEHLLHGAAPSLPQAYCAAIHGLRIGFNVGSCGAAAFRGEPVFVEDIETDPLWTDYRDLALAQGLRACWSTPIKAVDGRVLGTFANYYRRVFRPDQRDIDAIALITHIAALAIERHASDAALRESRETLRLALEGAELGIWSADLQTGRFESDARHKIINGEDLSSPAETLAEVRALIHPDDLRTIDAAFAAGICKAEYRLKAPGRDTGAPTRWVAVQGSIVRSPAGKAVRVLGISRDVTESKLVEQNLRKQQESFRALLGALPAAIFTTDAAGHITYCNEAAKELWRTAPELGKHKLSDLSKLFHTHGAPMKMDPRDAHLVHDREAILERADGTRVPITMCPTPLRNEEGAVVGTVNMMVDVGERKRAELALSERNAQLELAGRAARVGSYTFDLHTAIMQLSPGYAAIYGLPEGTVEITRDFWRTRVHPEDLSRLDRDRRRCFGAREPEHISEYRITRPDGNTRWIESRSRISYDARGRPERMVGVNIDVTERKLAEDQKTLLIAELDHRVKNVLASVGAIVEHTRLSSASLDEFLRVFDGRVRALANAHALLSRSRWHGVSLAELVRAELAPCREKDNAITEGDDIDLIAEAAQPMAMVVHELVTNAMKYGALSDVNGKVIVRWGWQSNGKAHLPFFLEWKEIGGPQVSPPNRIGYGTHVIRDLIAYELGGIVDLAFKRKGVQCRLELPAEWVSCGGAELVSDAPVGDDGRRLARPRATLPR